MLRALVRSYRDAFTGLPRQVWILASCLFVNRLGMMVLPFFELYLTEERSFRVADAGRIVALYGVGAVFGALAGGWLADRFGPRRVQITSLVLNGVFLLVLWRTRSTLAIAAAFMATSLAAESFRPANGAAISAAVGPVSRARAFSLMSLAVCVGLTFGLPLGGALAECDYAWLFLVDAGTALGAAWVLWRFGEREKASGARGAEPIPYAAASPWKDREFVLALLLQGATATVLFQFFGALPVFLSHDLAFAKGEVGRALALNAVVIALFEMQVIRRVEARPPLPWIGLGSFLICAGYGVNALAQGAGTAVLSILVWSAGEMLFFPLSAAYASSRAPAGAAGRYMSAYALAFALPFGLAPLLGTAIYERFGPSVLWGSCAGLGLLLGVAFQFLQRSVPAAPDLGRGP